MPRYQVTIDGKTIVLEGDHPPSEAEARAALNEHAMMPPPGGVQPSDTGAPTPEQAHRQALHDATQRSIADFNSKIPAMANLLGGQAIPGIGAASDAIGNVVKAGATRFASSPLAVNSGKAVALGAAYRAADAMGVPHSVLDPLLVAAGVQMYGGRGGAKPESAPEPMTESPIIKGGGTEAAPLRMKYNQTSQMGFGAQPTRGAQIVNPNIASGEAAAPAAQASQSSIPSLASLKPTIQEINPADMPRDWHAFEDATSRSAGDPVEKAQASRLHQEIMDANQRYRNSTVDERAAFKANPPSVQDLLVALLKGQK